MTGSKGELPPTPSSLIASFTVGHLAAVVVGFVVAVGWNGFFTSLFDYWTKQLGLPHDGPAELGMKLAYVVVMTVLAVLIFNQLYNQYKAALHPQHNGEAV